MICRNKTKNTVIAREIIAADNFKSRLAGLLGKSGLGEEEGLLITPCAQVHTFFMRFPIDALFLDRGFRVLRAVENMKPWKVSPWVMGAHFVLELKAGKLSGAVEKGDIVEFCR